MRKIDPNLVAHLAGAFAPLNMEAAAHAFPPTASLSTTLDKITPSAITNVVPHAKTGTIVKLFTTAAVDMWMRGVHSFLVSTSLTNVSPIWASVTGYYSSHYAVRSIAHLLGFFQLFSRNRIVRLVYTGGRFVCTFEPKVIHDREHRFYWKVVKSDPLFASDPFFTQNLPGDESDVGHRDRANYADHLPVFPNFKPLDQEQVKSRIDKISDIEFKAPPIPRVTLYPDLQSVQVIAYHRLVRFRELVDAVVTNNRFWRVHRDPPWARDFMDFQLVEEPSLRAEFTV